MDIKPAAARRGPKGEEPTDKEWEPLYTEDQRVMAGWIYHSWCYPAGYAYAVELNGLDNAEDVIYEKFAYGGAKVLTQQALARILGMAQPNVNRATKRLCARKMLSVDEDGRVCPTVQPALTAEERKALIGCDDQLGPERSTIPVELRQMVQEKLDGYEDYLAAEEAAGREVIRTDYLASVLEVCEAFNVKLKEIRTDRKVGIEQVCSAIPTLLPRSVDTPTRSSSSRSAPSSKAPHASQGPENDDGRGSVNEQHADGEGRRHVPRTGKGALGKEQLVGEWVRGVVEECGIMTDAAAIALLVKACRSTAPDCTAHEIGAGVQAKAAMAAKKGNPMGFLITAVPNLFSDGGLKKIREKLAKEQAATATANAQGQARSREIERDAEIFVRVEAAWKAMSERQQQAEIALAGKELQADKGDRGKHYRKCTPDQQKRIAVDVCLGAIRAEIEAEISQASE